MTQPCPGRVVECAPTPFGVRFVHGELHRLCQKCVNYVPEGDEILPAVRNGECPNFKERNELQDQH